MKQDDIKNILSNISRWRWACRRGMLELDVLLGNFLEEAYADLSLQNKHIFIRLLDCKDPDLFAWIMGHEVPRDPEFAYMTEVIRHHARSRFSANTL